MEKWMILYFYLKFLKNLFCVITCQKLFQIFEQITLKKLLYLVGTLLTTIFIVHPSPSVTVP